MNNQLQEAINKMNQEAERINKQYQQFEEQFNSNLNKLNEMNQQAFGAAFNEEEPKKKKSFFSKVKGLFS